MTTLAADRRITLTRSLDASPEAVFAAFTAPETAGRFLFATADGAMERVEIDARPGGAFRIDERRGEVLARHVGRFTALEPGRRLAFGFAVEEGETPSPVEITLAAEGAGTLLTLVHDIAPEWAEWQGRVRAGWDRMLDSLGILMAEAPRTLALTRHYPCPVERLWSAWTDPARLPLWWGPRGFTCRTHEIDLREGGQWRFDMIGPDGTVYPNRHRFRRIRPMSQIDYDLDDDGKGEHAFRALVRFWAEGEGARVSLIMLTGDATERYAMAEFGAIDFGYTTLDCLAEAAMAGEGAHVVSVTRRVPASAERVWAAWTDPVALARWYVPDDCTMSDPGFEPHEGGAYGARFTEKATGKEFPFSGRYLALDPPGRLVFSHAWEGGESGETVITVTLVPEGPAMTRVTLLQRGVASAASAASHAEGWTQVLASLAREVAP